MEPLQLSITEVRKAIPPRLFKRSTFRSVSYLARDVVLAYALAYSVIYAEEQLAGSPVLLKYPIARRAAEALLWLAYWWFQGLVFTGLWVIGHECGHGAFSESRNICHSIGFLIHTLLWTPYFSWRISHHRHHANHASMERDEVYVPHTRSELGIPQESNASQKIDYSEYFEDTPLYTLLLLVRQQVLAFPAYLTFNVSGQRHYPRFTNHFDPRSILFRTSQSADVIISDIGMAAMVYVTFHACRIFGTTAVIKLYGIPWLCVTHWFVMITYMHHTAPYIPHYRQKAWSFARGAAATVDRDFLGWQGRFFLHDVAHFHVIHHFFPQMPWYNGEEATQYLKQAIGKHYLYSSEPIFKELWRSYNECQFVEDEGDVIFYKNRHGKAMVEDLHLEGSLSEDN